MRSEGVHDSQNVLSIERGFIQKPRRRSLDFSSSNTCGRSQKENTRLRRAYPCLEKLNHVRIASTIGSTTYTSIKDWKIHNGSSNHDRTGTCLNITYKNINDAEGWSWSLISKTDPKSTKWTWWSKMVLHCKLRCHIKIHHEWLQHIRWSGIN